MCYDNKEVNTMEHEQQENILPTEEAQEEKPYVPRPVWQVWAARLGLVVFLAFLVMYYILIARGG